MNGKTGLILTMALICGLGAMYGAQQLLSKPTPQIDLVDVVVAARDLKMDDGTVEEALKIVKYPKSQVPEGAFSTIESLAARFVAIPILVGEPIVEPKLTPKGMPPGLYAQIPAGKVAYSIEVNEQSGVSGFVMPGHHVDIIESNGDKIGPDGGPLAHSLLKNVEVLASGQVTTRPEDKSIQVRTITLALTEKQAQMLAAAPARGKLSLALRGPQDGTEEVAEEEEEPEPVPQPEREPQPPLGERMVALLSKAVAEIKTLQPPPPPPPAPQPEVEPTPPPVPLPPPRYTIIHRGLEPPQRIVHRPKPSAAIGGIGVASGRFGAGQ